MALYRSPARGRPHSVISPSRRRRSIRPAAGLYLGMTGADSVHPGAWR